MKKLHILTGHLLLICLSATSILSCGQNPTKVNLIESPDDIKTGAEQTEVYFPWLKGKKIAVVANQTSVIGEVHLVDTLQKSNFKVVKVFCPEHGFRGEAEAGEKVGNHIDKQSGLPVISLYGNNRKPSPKDMNGIDLIVFDIQDVGARFYTYISTLSLVMEACAESNIPIIILDRPNPNGHYIDGPVLEKKHASFIGMHEIPIVHGMTIAEYALMVNGEGWLTQNLKCDIKYVKLINYNHNSLYHLPIKPSPNLSEMGAVYLYPSLCLFEGTIISIARGTEFPFQAYGHPGFKDAPFSFTPVSLPGISMDPPHKGKLCKGYDLRSFGKNYFCNHRQIYLFWLISAYTELGSKPDFFNSGFDRLAGTSSLREQIIAGKTEEEIRATWQEGIEKFKKIRNKYLLYPDFE